MNNEFYQSSCNYRKCYQGNKCYNQGCVNNSCLPNQCCSSPRPNSQQCCPTTVTVGTTVPVKLVPRQKL